MAAWTGLLLFALFTPVAEADSVTDTIGIYVGYFGWPEDQFVEKATYKWSDLDDQFGGALDTRVTIYSYQNGGRTYLAAGRGFMLRDLLEHAGIDLSSIASLDFFTKDQTVGPYRSFTKYSILDMPRYYFPNLAVDANTLKVRAYDGGDIRKGATRVETMLALEDYTEWDAIGYEFEKNYDRDMFSPASRFHLFFGQASPQEANTSSAAKYVYKIFVTFAGSPVLSTDETNIGLKVGSDFKVNLNVAAEDGLLDGYVAAHILWSSSDESVATVDSSGRLNVKKEGTTVITASFGKSSVSVNVSVNGEGGGGGDGSGGQSAGAQGDGGQGTEERSAPSGGETPSSDKSGVYILSDELMSQADYVKWVDRVMNPDSGVKNTAGTLSQSSNAGMGDGAQQLVLLKHNNIQATVVISLTLAAFLAIGFAYGVLSFRYRLKKG
ncbi:MAG TPA: Ig-like domain-containing protein [Bacillota bacterium]|nr:Ig-like domain-containing protein [Bacillota bacterium]